MMHGQTNIKFKNCLYRNLSSLYTVVRLQEEWLIYADDTVLILC